MSLRAVAAADMRRIVENADDFGWPITVTTPDETAVDVVGLSADVGLTIDPQTGTPIAGRRASVSLSIASLHDHGLTDLPRAINDRASKPWRITFADIMGTSREYKVADAMPDLTLGVVVCILEIYRP